MKYTNKLFSIKKIYSNDSDKLFLEAIKENILYHKTHSDEYSKILKKYSFNEENLKSIENLKEIPPLPTSFIKQRNLYSIPPEKYILKGTSSGTGGKKSLVGMDFETSLNALKMALNVFSYHKLFSITPTNYIVLGYEPNKNNSLGAAQTAFATTLATPALHREYALKFVNDNYKLNFDGIKKYLQKYDKSNFPVRFMGFPSYLYFMMEELKKDNLKFKYNNKSKIFTAGGWKSFYKETQDRKVLYMMAKEIFDIDENNFQDFYGAVEHPIIYCDCKNHHFHVPVYSRVLIRDVKTLEPLPYGEAGIVNLMTPLIKSMPLISVMTDDIGIMYEGSSCGCQNETPYLKILGRAGMADIKTCAASATDLLNM